MADALVCWQGDRADQRALEQQPDWSGLTGIDGLWPLLAERHGALTAVEAAHGSAPESLSFQALHERIAQLAACLAAQGISAGDVVAQFAENGPRWLAVDQGLMRLGAANAVRGSQAPVEELAYILGDCGARALCWKTPACWSRCRPLAPWLACALCCCCMARCQPPAPRCPC